ncbi:hypothetical protein FRC12_005379 [Ceratobasidium sp. 428]|nr:hypothetical protein FRC12_005379 [Ceratobasidium sp. 428]
MGPTRQPSSCPLSAVVPPTAPVKRPRLTLQDRLDVIRSCEENPHLTDGEAAWMLRHSGYHTINQPTVWQLKKQKNELEELAKNPNKRQFKRVRRVEYPNIAQALRVWILQKLGGRG